MEKKGDPNPQDAKTNKNPQRIMQLWKIHTVDIKVTTSK